MTITTEQFKQKHGFTPRDHNNLTEFDNLIEGRLDPDQTRELIKNYRSEESWVRLYDLKNPMMTENNTVQFLYAICLDAILYFSDHLGVSRSTDVTKIFKGKLLEQFNAIHQFVENNRQASENLYTPSQYNRGRNTDLGTPQKPMRPRALTFTS